MFVAFAAMMLVQPACGQAVSAEAEGPCPSPQAPNQGVPPMAMSELMPGRQGDVPAVRFL